MKIKKKCVTKREIIFQDCKGCMRNNKIKIRSHQSFRSKAHDVFTERLRSVQMMIKQ